MSKKLQIRNSFAGGELPAETVIRNFRTTAEHGKAMDYRAAAEITQTFFATTGLHEISGTAGTRASSPQETAGGQDGRAPAEDDEAAMLRQWLKLSEAEAGLKRELKTAESALDAKAYALYPKLSAAEVRMLVVDDKWLAALDAAVHGEMDRISQALTQRVKELAERYDTPLPQMTGRVAELEAKVNTHLKKMGFEP